MPIYEYMCSDCCQRTELMRSMKDADAPVQCRACGGEHTRRMLSVFAAHSSGRAHCGGRVVAGSSGGGCAGCSGGACGSCGSR